MLTVVVETSESNASRRSHELESLGLVVALSMRLRWAGSAGCRLAEPGAAVRRGRQGLLLLP